MCLARSNAGQSIVWERQLASCLLESVYNPRMGYDEDNPRNVPASESHLQFPSSWLSLETRRLDNSIAVIGTLSNLVVLN